VDYQKLVAEFETRLRLGCTRHAKKYARILESRRVAKMELIEFQNDEQDHGNDPTQEKEGTRSKYQSTLFKAIGDSIIRDITAKPMRYEWGANNNEGIKVKRAFDKILTKAYSYTGTDKEKLSSFYHLIYSSCSIIEPYSEKKSRKIIKQDGTIDILPSGRVVSFRSYDPLFTVLDWNSDPFDVAGTSQFAIVYIGKFTKESLEALYGKKAVKALPDTPVDEYGSIRGAGNSLETMKDNLHNSAGHTTITGFPVYEYYTLGGKRYTIARGYGVIQESINSNGAYDELPLLVTPMFIDPDSPYGISLYETLQQALDVVSTSINHIADTNNLSIKSPTFIYKGLLTKTDFTLKDSLPTDIVELDVSGMLLAGVTSIPRIEDTISRINFKEVTEGSMFLMKNSLDHIWMMTGKSPTDLGGIQDKQIRVSGVADMTQASSLRSSSMITSNLESYMLNPLTQTFARMFAMYWEDFPEFKALGIDEKDIKNIQQNIRVVNGSYLPSDQFNEMQRTDALLNYQMTTRSQSIDATQVFMEWATARGETSPERFLVDPLTTMTREQTLRLAQIIQQGNINQFVAQVMQSAAQVQKNG